MEKRIKIAKIIILVIILFYIKSPPLLSHKLVDDKGNVIKHIHLDQDSHINKENLNPVGNHYLRILKREEKGEKIKYKVVFIKIKKKHVSKHLYNNLHINDDHTLTTDQREDLKKKQLAFLKKKGWTGLAEKVEEGMKEEKERKKGMERIVEQLKPPTFEYDCIGFIFGKKAYIMEDFDSKKMGFEKIDLKEEKIEKCNYVAYYKDGKFKHIAHVVKVDKTGKKVLLVESKWGRQSLFRHHPDDVQPDWGKEREYFRKPKKVEGVEEKPKFIMPGITYPGEFTLSVKVETKEGEPVEGATVEIESEISEMLNEEKSTAITNENGYAYLSFEVHPGLFSYRLRIHKHASPKKIIWDQELFVRGVQD